MSKSKTIKIKIIQEKAISMPDVKYCKGCKDVKLIEEFYKTGYKNYRGGNCKRCSNQQRKKYKIIKYDYVPRTKKKLGFFKLPEAVQNSIRYDLYIKKNKKSIAKEHNIVYETFLRWCRNTIPEYTN
jgi:hypothetical protein